MTVGRRDFASFARAVEALEPYLDELVFVGGWAHFLYTLRNEAAPLSFEPLRTADADVATPTRLASGRPSIVECLTRAGFTEHLLGDHDPPVSEYVLRDGPDGFYLEFLAPLVGGEVKRGGRSDVTARVGGITAQKLRHVNVLLSAPWKVGLTRGAGFPVTRRRDIQIPNPAAYVVQKMLVLPNRPTEKQAKDLLYVHDTFAIFTDAFDTVRAAWEDLRRVMVPNHVRTFEKGVVREMSAVTDLVRRAARMTTNRPVAVTPEVLLGGLRLGFSRAFGLVPETNRPG